MIDSEGMEDCCVEIVPVDSVLNSRISDSIRIAIVHTALKSSTGDPDRKAILIVVTPRTDGVCCGFSERCSSEFTSEQDHRIFKHPPLSKVLDKSSDGLVDASRFAEMILFAIFMAVPINPRALEGPTGEELDEPDSVFK